MPKARSMILTPTSHLRMEKWSASTTGEESEPRSGNGSIERVVIFGPTALAYSMVKAEID